MNAPHSGATSSFDVLARCPLFAELAAADLEALAGIATRRTYAAGEAVFLAGSPAEGIHVVARGTVRVYVLSPQTGRELVLTVERPYSSVAELPTFDRGPYPANAEATEDTDLVILEAGRLERLLRERPEIALHLLRTLGRRLRRLVGVVEGLSFQEVVHRLAAYLLERAEDAIPFELETNARIAAAIGTVPELASRNLSRLAAMGVIRLEGRWVREVHAERLREFAESAGR